MKSAFDELQFFAEMKARPGLYLGTPSLCSLRDHIFGMDHAFRLCGMKDALPLFTGFILWYHQAHFGERPSGYECWWNHLLYTSGGDDQHAFHAFFRTFERYLKEQRGMVLPEASWK